MAVTCFTAFAVLLPQSELGAGGVYFGRVFKASYIKSCANTLAHEQPKYTRCLCDGIIVHGDPDPSVIGAAHA